MTTATTHFTRVATIFVTLNARGVDRARPETRIFIAWIGAVAGALRINTDAAQDPAYVPLPTTVLDDHAMRLTIRELTEAARAVPAPENVADDWHEAIDALACVAGALCNGLPRHAEAMVSSRGGAA